MRGDTDRLPHCDPAGLALADLADFEISILDYAAALHEDLETYKLLVSVLLEQQHHGQIRERRQRDEILRLRAIVREYVESPRRAA